jgi:hypothetical protein
VIDIGKVMAGVILVIYTSVENEVEDAAVVSVVEAGVGRG